MPRRALALDDMVEFLAQEDEFWDHRVHDPRLWKEKKGQYETSHERHREKRHRLSHYYECKNRVDHNSQSLSVFDVCKNINDLFLPDGEVEDTKNNSMLFIIFLFIVLFIILFID
jgi:hypothetical protein